MLLVLALLLVAVKGVYIERNYIDTYNNTNCTLQFPVAGIKFNRNGIACIGKGDIIPNSIFIDVKYVHWLQWPHFIEGVYYYDGQYWNREDSHVYVRHCRYIEINPIPGALLLFKG